MHKKVIEFIITIFIKHFKLSRAHPLKAHSRLQEIIFVLFIKNITT